MGKFNRGDRVRFSISGVAATVVGTNLVQVKDALGRVGTYDEEMFDKAEDEVGGYKVGDRIIYRKGDPKREECGIVTEVHPESSTIKVFWARDRSEMEHSTRFIQNYCTKG